MSAGRPFPIKTQCAYTDNILIYFPGAPVERGAAGPQGPKGIQGKSGKVGVTYIRWGKRPVQILEQHWSMK